MAVISSFRAAAARLRLFSRTGRWRPAGSGADWDSFETPYPTMKARILLIATALALSAQARAEFFSDNVVGGAILGAVAGGIIGNNTGDGDGARGALIGAGSGLVLGALIDAQDSRRGSREVIVHSSYRDRDCERPRRVICDDPPRRGGSRTEIIIRDDSRRHHRDRDDDRGWDRDRRDGWRDSRHDSWEDRRRAWIDDRRRCDRDEPRVIIIEEERPRCRDSKTIVIRR